jgi:hypothetical protein
MKNFACSFFGIIIFLGCSKEQNSKPDNISEARPSESNQIGASSTLIDLAKSEKRPIIRFRWSGIEPTPGTGKKNPCAGGDCGVCVGLCVIFKWGIFDPQRGISPQERESGLATARVKIEGGVLIMEPDTSCDNGDGTVTVTEDFYIGKEYSQVLGMNRVVIKKGKYLIDYLPGLRFGRIRFNILKE